MRVKMGLAMIAAVSTALFACAAGMLVLQPVQHTVIGINLIIAMLLIYSGSKSGVVEHQSRKMTNG